MVIIIPGVINSNTNDFYNCGHAPPVLIFLFAAIATTNKKHRQRQEPRYKVMVDKYIHNTKF